MPGSIHVNYGETFFVSLSDAMQTKMLWIMNLKYSIVHVAETTFQVDLNTIVSGTRTQILVWNMHLLRGCPI